MVRRWEILAAIGRGNEDLAVVKMGWLAARREAKGRREDIIGRRRRFSAGVRLGTERVWRLWLELSGSW